MNLGARVTLYATLLVGIVLGISSVAALQIRQADLEADLRREASEVAEALLAGIEPLDPRTAREDLVKRVWSTREGVRSFQLEVLRVGDERVADPGWASLVEAAEIEDKPVGKLFAPEGRRPFYAMAVPLYDEAAERLPLRDPARKAVAFLGMKRDTGTIGEEVRATARRTLPLFVAVVGFLAVGVYVTIFTSVLRPLRRLLDGLEAVARGDLSRVLLAERDDEIGALAGRFNAMTGSLRDARAETARGAEARLALEGRLRQSEKLATIGQMAAEIAHEVGTPLAVISGRARSLARKAGDPVEVEKNAGIVSAQADRIAKIIRQVLDFSRKSGPTKTEVSLDQVVAEALEFVGEALRRQRVTADVRAANELPRVPGDPDQIQQVCLNLLMNAAHAMPSGGTLSVRLDRVVRRKEGLDLAPPAEYVLLEISDTGPGIPAEHRDRIFEPFFTTKDEGQGTGLGLAVSKGIVKDHDGWIEVDGRSDGASGAVFRVYLPTGAAAEQGRTTPVSMPIPP